MAETILFVFEGKKPEFHIQDNIESTFFEDISKSNIRTTYGTDIYQLWKQVQNEEFLDLIEILKECCTENCETLKDIEQMLSCFNDEFDCGKLYVSYPMVEAVKDAVPEFQYHTVPAKEKSDYKKRVSERTIYQDINFIDHAGWLHIISNNLKKSNFIVNRDYSEPEKHPQQDSIFDGQQKHYIKPNGTIAVLSGIPFFIVEYFGREKLSKILTPASHD